MKNRTEIIVDSVYKIPSVTAHEREVPNFEARIALSLAERWGMVAAEIDGEDSSGRSKMRRMTPGEVTEAACDTAALLVEEFTKRGWMIELPSIVEHMAATKAAEDQKDEERRRARAQ